MQSFQTSDPILSVNTKLLYLFISVVRIHGNLEQKIRSNFPGIQWNNLSGNTNQTQSFALYIYICVSTDVTVVSKTHIYAKPGMRLKAVFPGAQQSLHLVILRSNNLIFSTLHGLYARITGNHSRQIWRECLLKITPHFSLSTSSGMSKRWN